MPKTAVFTICARNYLHFAQTLMQSLKLQHPSWERYLLLADKSDGIDIKAFDFSIQMIDELPHPNIYQFIFRYNILELATAAKPWMFEYLFREGFERVIYLDPDIYVFQPLVEVEKAFSEGGFMVLTPHLTGFLDDKKPNEHDILLAGAYNLGFVGLADNPQLNQFLTRWKNQLEFHCVIDFNKGYFVDQKWFDLAPGLFENVKILRHSGYNTAYWNLFHRRITEHKHQYKSGSDPLVFYHFSGINPNMPENVSKHQNRYRLSDLPVLQKVFNEYIKLLKVNGLGYYSKYKYGYDCFSNGYKIPEILNQCYRERPLLAEKAGINPFDKCEVFLEDINKGKDSPLLNPLMLYIWEIRPDLQNIFPDIRGADLPAFCNWFINTSLFEYHIPLEYIALVRKSMEIYKRTHPGRQNIPRPSAIYLKNRFYQLFLLLNKRFNFMKGYIPSGLKRIIKRILLNDFRTSENQLSPKLMAGVNIIGYTRAEMGIGEVSRITAKAIYTTDIPYGLIDYKAGNTARAMDDSWAMKETQKPLYQTNIFAMNADGLMTSHIYLGIHTFTGRYNIGYWAWELPEFPEEWTPAFNLLNEVWVLSNFILKSISDKATIPVMTMPLAIKVGQNGKITREHFRLPGNRFLFLTMYDTHSFQARKNPQGSILAFQKAFKPRTKEAGLVVKINNPATKPDEITALKKMIEGWPNIYLIDAIISRAEMDALLALTDSFISLHRSEGFGLGLAEAMYLEKPVIGTNWSGNTDFMKMDNSCPVNYQLVKVGSDHGPYKAFQYWAEPDIDHAVHYMKKILEDPAWGKRIGSLGAETIHSDFSPAAVGQMMYSRLQRLGLLSNKI